MRELREAKGLTYQTLALRMDTILKGQIEEALRGMGMDMRGAWPRRDVLLERLRVRPDTLERWEKVGFGVQRGTRATEFYRSPAFLALIRVLDAQPDDMVEESSNATLQPGDTVVRPVDDEGYPTLDENATGTARFFALPDGFGGTFLKEERDVTDADHEAVRVYRKEEAAFLDAETEQALDAIVQAESADLDAEWKRLLDEHKE